MPPLAMFSTNNSSHSSVPRIPSHQPSPVLEPQVPRGECGFIVTESDGSRQRCNCRSFYANSPIVRSQCGCGHQAWHHEAQPLSSVSVEEHIGVVQELQRLRRSVTTLEQMFMHERKKRKESEAAWNKLHERQYQNMAHLKIDFDDKIEGVIDQSSNVQDIVASLKLRVESIDDATMELETRMERLDPRGGVSSRSLTPLVEQPILERNVDDSPDARRELPIRSFERRLKPATWTVCVVFVPRKAQQYAFEYDSPGMRRCQSRGLTQEIAFSGADCMSFTNTIESKYQLLLKERPWMPLIGYRPQNEPFGRIVLRNLSDKDQHKLNWDHAFLDEHCIVHDKFQGDLLYVALKHEDLSWQDIKFLPQVGVPDDTSWEHNEELDGPHDNFQKSIDERVMYDYPDPPPYSSRTQSEASRHYSGLEMLANASSALLPLSPSREAASSPARRPAPSVRSLDERSISEASLSHHSAPSVSNLSISGASATNMSGHSELSRVASSIGSVMDVIMSDDEHRDKKARTRTAHGMLAPPGSSSGSSTHLQPNMYVSGRSKRRLSTSKVREPVHINVSGWTPIKNLRGRMSSNREVPEEQMH